MTAFAAAEVFGQLLQQGESSLPKILLHPDLERASSGRRQAMASFSRYDLNSLVTTTGTAS